MALRAASVCRAVVVLLFGDELLNLFDLGLTGRSHLGELDNPKALKLLVGVLAGHGIERVRKPLFTELLQSCTLAAALRTDKNEHVVVLAARR